MLFMIDPNATKCVFTLIFIVISLLSAFDYGNHDDASFNLSATVEFHSGSNTVDILSMMVGLQVRGVRVL